jgi:hypothetical protein
MLFLPVPLVRIMYPILGITVWKLARNLKVSTHSIRELNVSEKKLLMDFPLK